MAEKTGRADTVTGDVLRQAILVAKRRYDEAVERGTGVPAAKARYMNTLFNHSGEIIQRLDACAEMRETIGSLQAALDEADGQIIGLRAALQEGARSTSDVKAPAKRKPKEGGRCEDGICEM